MADQPESARTCRRADIYCLLRNRRNFAVIGRSGSVPDHRVQEPADGTRQAGRAVAHG